MNQSETTQFMCRNSMWRGFAEKIEQEVFPDECGLCGKTENLVDFGGEKYCEGYCLKQAKENARINAREAELESWRYE